VTGTETGNGSSAKTVIQQHGTSAGTATTVMASPTTLPADGKSTSTITATVTGAGAANDPVYFLVSPSTCGSLSAVSATTNTSGVATATYTASLTAPVTCTIVVFEADGSTAGSATVGQTIVNNKITATAAPAAIKGDGIQTSTVTATVTSGVDGSAISGDALTWVVTGGNCGALSNTSATTNASGVGTATYTSSVNFGGIGHFCTVTVTESGTSQSASASIDQTT
jgi:adhesin/invasin